MSFLFILQVANYIVPLLLIPYLGKVLGAENFGKISFAQAFVSYFILLTDFGFNVSSTKEIADAQRDKRKISEVFWNTILIKFLLLIVCFCIFIFIIFFFNRFREDSDLYFISFLSVVSSFVFPLWLFQGLEKMGQITIINTIPRLIMLLLTFYFVKESSDYKIALFIQVAAPLFSSALSLIIVFKNKLVDFVKPSFKKSIIRIKDSWYIFASSLSSNLYTTTNTVILGILTNDVTVGVYSAADKVIRALISLISSITQVIFPRVNVYFRESKEKYLKFMKQLLLTISLICIILAIFLFTFSDKIIELLFGIGDFDRTIKVLKYSSILPFFSVINGIIAINVFITIGKKKELLKIVTSGCLFSLVIISPLVYYFYELGPVFSVLLTEILILFLFVRKLNKIKLYVK